MLAHLESITILPTMLNTRSWRYRLLLTAASAWILLLFTAPLLKAFDSLGAGLSYLIFSGICHQETERSYLFMGMPLAVCARCIGLYLGFWSGLLVIPHLRSLQEILSVHPRMFVLFLIPMVIDLMTSNTHLSRTFSGSIAAFPMAFFVALAAEQLRFPELRRRFQ